MKIYRDNYIPFFYVIIFFGRKILMNILFVEDNESIIDGVLYAFKKDGYNI